MDDEPLLRDLSRGRRTEADIGSGYVSQPGAQIGVPVPMNAAIAATVQLIEESRLWPAPALPASQLHRAG